MGKQFGGLANLRGFTLIELIMVIVMMGILAIFAVPKMFDFGIFNARGFHDETIALLRFAQKTAVAQRRTVCVGFSASTVNLSIAASAPTAAAPTPDCGVTPNVLIGLNGSAAQVTAKAGTTFSATPANFNFNGFGQPINSDGSAASTKSIQVSGASKGIVVETATGYVHESP